MISKNIKGYYGVISRITKPVEIGVEENNNNHYNLFLLLLNMFVINIYVLIVGLSTI